MFTKLFLSVISSLFLVACAPATGANPVAQTSGSTTSTQQLKSGCRGIEFIKEVEAAVEANPHRASITYDFEARGCLEGKIVAFSRRMPGIGQSWNTGPTGIFLDVKIEEDRGFELHYSHERDSLDWVQQQPPNLTPKQEKEWDKKVMAAWAEQDRLAEESVTRWESFVLSKSVGDMIRAECDLLRWDQPVDGSQLPETIQVHKNCDLMSD